MPAHRANPRRAKLNHPYTVEQVARLYGKHPQTIRDWIRRGLPTIDDRRPLIVRGRDLRTFLDGLRSSKKHPCPPGTIYCFTCRVPRRPALGMADFEAREQGAGNLKALCGVCETVMRRRANEARIAEILPGIEVRIVRAERRLTAPPEPCPNPHFDKD